MDNTGRDLYRTLDVLQRVPQRPRSLRRPANWPIALQSVADYVTSAPQWLARVRGRLNRYPKPFRKLNLRSADGTPLSAWLGIQTDTKGRPSMREGILVVPGMFTSKDLIIHKARAQRIFRDLGYHVLVIDMRGFGESQRAHNTGGWKESEDVAAAAATFREHAPLSTLHVYAESMGASATLIAAADAASAGSSLVDGAILAISPYADLDGIAHHLDATEEWESQLYMIQWFFHQLLHLAGRQQRTFVEYLAQAAEDYGTDLETLFRLGSPVYRLAEINVPTLIVISDHDPVLPPRHAASFAMTAEDAPAVAVWRLPWGSHCLFEMADPDWFWTVLREFFDFYCLLPQR